MSRSVRPVGSPTLLSLFVPSCLAVFAGCVSNTVPGAAPDAPETKELEHGLFDGVAPLNITFLVDYRGADEDGTTIEKFHSGALEVPGRLVIERPTGPESIVTRVRSTGNLSRQLCRHPKLELALDPKPEERERVLKKFGDRFFLIRHCNEDDEAAGVLPDASNARRHHFAYQLQAVLGLPHLRTRQAWARYEDVETRKHSNARFAFFLEDAFTAADQRFGGKDRIVPPGEVTSGLSYRDLDGAATAKALLFQIMLNNRDFEIADFRPLPRCLLEVGEPTLHNTFIIGVGAGAKVPLVFDFDLSTFAGLPEAVLPIVGDDRAYLDQIADEQLLPDAEPLLRWLVLRNQHLRRHLSEPELLTALDLFRSKRAEIEATLVGLDIDEKSKGEMRRHIDVFYASIEPAQFFLPRSSGASVMLDTLGGKKRCHLPNAATVSVLADEGDRLQVRLLEKKVVVEGRLADVCPSFPERVGWVASTSIER